MLAQQGYEPCRGSDSVIRLRNCPFHQLAEQHGWTPEREHEGGPVISLETKGASITLEPGCQLELSGAPADTIHQVCAEFRGHMRELGPMSDLPPAFPLASAALAPLRAKAETQGDGGFSPLWCGQNAAGCSEIPAAKLTRRLAGLR